MRPKKVEIPDLRREDKVRFRYEGRGRVLDVEGIVDKISRDAIYVGNECWQGDDCIHVYNTRGYKAKKIQDNTLEKIG